MTSPPVRPPVSEDESARASEWRAVWDDRSLWGLVFLLVSSAWMDALYVGHFSPRGFCVRLLWAGAVGAVTFVPKATVAQSRAALYFLIVVSVTCMVLLTDLVGGVGTPYFLMVVTVPQAVGLALPQRQERGAIRLAGVVCSTGTLWLLWRTPQPLFESAMWLFMVVLTTCISDFLSARSSRLLHWEREVRDERARRAALEALAQSEHRRAQAEKLALVGQLAAGVAHEINNPLAYVGSNVEYVREELLATRDLDTEELADILAETRLGLRHIQQIVADLKGFSRMETQEPAECSLSEVVADAMKLASLRLKHVAWLHLDVPLDLPKLFAVRQRLVQVVLNLLVNASDVLETHRVGEGEVRVTGRQVGARVVLLIEDNGPGFEPEVLGRLFEPFFTTKAPDKGTGLGLNLSRELAVQFGGQLTASNRPEGGARLCLELPVSASRDTPNMFPAANTPPG